MVLSYSRPDPPVGIQASDRLLTDTNKDPLDPAANKSVVFSTRGALVVLGYSGRAVLDFGRGTEKTTDHWLAEQLCSRALAMAPLTMGTPAYEWDLGLALRHIRSSLDTSRQFSEQGVEINFCGVQWRRGRMDRGLFAASGDLDAGGDGDQLTHVRSRAKGDTPHVLRTAGGELPDAHDLLDRLARSSSPDNAEDLLVAAIRDAASRSSLIGRDCLIVRISAHGVRVRYDGQRPSVGPDPMPGRRFLGSSPRGPFAARWCRVAHECASVSCPSRSRCPKLSLRLKSSDRGKCRGASSSESGSRYSAYLRLDMGCNRRHTAATR